jgi:hypothetical protein
MRNRLPANVYAILQVITAWGVVKKKCDRMALQIGVRRDLSGWTEDTMNCEQRGLRAFVIPF